MIFAALLKSQIFRAVVVALALITSVLGFGRWRYAVGYRTGVVVERTESQRQAAIAKAYSDSAWAEMYAQAVASRDSLRKAEAMAARARARSAVAESKLADALAAVAADTAPPSPACGELATACANAAAAWTAERDTLTNLLTTHGAALAHAEALARQEPERTRAAIRLALAQDRATQRRPSRLRWFVAGASLATLGMVIR